MLARTNSTIFTTSIAVVCCLALAGKRASAADVLATAVSGSPYGVATIEIPLDVPVIGNAIDPLKVSEAADRIMYQTPQDVRTAVAQRPSDRPVPAPGRGRLLNRVGNLIRELASTDDELQQTVSRKVSFLFRGDAPLDLTVSDRRGQIGVYRITPMADRAANADLMKQWWSLYTESARTQIESADYPAWIETYLVAMLSGRTGMPLPTWYTEPEPTADPLIDTLKLLAGESKQTTEIFRSAAAGDALPEGPASLPLPASPRWAPEYDRPGLDSVVTEPLASRVPPECFYLRYGSFENFLWFKDLSAEYGGDVSAMATLRGIADDAMGRMETQLNMKTNEMSRMMGGSVIEDQAIIGRDLFMADGASLGVLIKPKNTFLLRTSLTAERATKAKQNETISLTDLKVDGHAVTLLRSADNSVRSYYAEDGDYILVANSLQIVKRFFEVGKSGESLATTSEFRLARQLMPLEREDSLFIYLAPAMLRGLVEPDYLIELRRRLYAKADIHMVHMARLAAAAEGSTLTGIDELKDAGYLPETFGRRPDSSGVIAVGDAVIDTARGRRGSFLPIADAEIQTVTSVEAEWYSQIAAEYSQRFRSVSPITIGIHRETLDESPGIERVSVHAEVAPWDPTQYGWVSEQLGPPTNVAIQFAPDDIIAVQAHVASDTLGPPTHLFAAIKDSIPPSPDAFDGILKSFMAVRGIPGYLGAWPQPGALDRLPLGLGLGQPAGPGMTRLIGGIYRYTGGGFSVLSFDPNLLTSSLQHMAAVEVPDSAQLRAHVGNLIGSQIETWANSQLYDRAADASGAGAKFLDMFTRQLGVEPQSAMIEAEKVLGGKMQCTLGGEYRYSEKAGQWASTAWGGMTIPPPTMPASYVAPLMSWFRGGSATVTQYPDRVVADAVIDIARKQ